MVGPILEVAPVFFWSVVVVSVLVLSVVVKQGNRKGCGFLFLLLLSLAVVGGTVGFLSGRSRIGVAGNVLPAGLVFLGVGAAYLFTVDIRKSAFAALGVISFTVTLLFTYYSAAFERSNWEFEEGNYKSSRDSCLSFILSADYSDLESKEKRRTRAHCKPYVDFLQ